MLLGFETNNEIKAKAAFIIYAVYKSRDKKRGPSGVDMWGQIERFAKSSAKRSEGIDEFISIFKKKMACSTINPKYLKNDSESASARVLDSGEIMVFRNKNTRSFGIEVLDDDESGKGVVECIYRKTQIIILLVRDRLEREKMFEEDSDNEN